MSGSTVQQLCEGQNNYQEKPNNNNQFGAWFGLNNQPWCAIFVSWVFEGAGRIREVAPASKPKGFASCDEWLKYLTKKGQLVPIGDAQEDDIVFFQFDADKEPDHVGIVKRNRKKLKVLECWEGNTSSGNKGSQSNGDGVYLRKRSYAIVMAVARPTGRKK